MISITDLQIFHYSRYGSARNCATTTGEFMQNLYWAIDYAAELAWVDSEVTPHYLFSGDREDLNLVLKSLGYTQIPHNVKYVGVDGDGDICLPTTETVDEVRYMIWSHHQNWNNGRPKTKEYLYSTHKKVSALLPELDLEPATDELAEEAAMKFHGPATDSAWIQRFCETVQPSLMQPVYSGFDDTEIPVRDQHGNALESIWITDSDVDLNHTYQYVRVNGVWVTAPTWRYEETHYEVVL